MRSDPAGTLACTDTVVPVRRRQRVQWQYDALSGTRSTSNRTPPHRQPPVSGSSVIAPTLVENQRVA
jgi:hypothetical protein